jgi:hypothetical protein
MIGILTGLYIADNAREQLAQANAASQAEEELAPEATDRQPFATETEAEEMPELPPMDPVETYVVEEEVVPEVPEVTEVAKTPTVEDSIDDASATDIPAEPVEVDDFEEVSPEEIEQAMPQEADAQ